MAWWIRFLPQWNGRAPFLEPAWTPAEALNLFTDASGTHGFGAYFSGAWLRGPWQPHQMLRSIQWQELFAILAATSTWGHRLTGRRVVVHCDNQAIVLAWSGQSSRCSDIMVLLRELFFTAATHSFTIRLEHVPGRLNALADALSRNQISLFFSLAPKADPQPTPLSPHLLEL